MELLEDAALLLTYLVAGAFPVAYNYAIARRLAKRYAVKVISSSDGSEKSKQLISTRNLAADDLRVNFRVENVAVREGRIYLNLVIDEDALIKLFSDKKQQ